MATPMADRESPSQVQTMKSWLLRFGALVALLMLAASCQRGERKGIAPGEEVYPGATVPIGPRATLKPPVGEYLFSTPRAIASFEHSVVLEYRNDQFLEEDPVFLLAVPQGAKTLYIDDIVLRDPITGSIEELADDHPLFRNPGSRTELYSRFMIQDIGVLRQVPVARLTVNTGRKISSLSPPRLIHGFRIRVQGPQGQRKDRAPVIADTAIDNPASPYRHFLTHAVANSDALNLYRVMPQPAPIATVDPMLPGWMPLPELSPGMPWIRIPVRAEGLYVIDELWMRAAGLDPSSVLPSELRLISEGKDVPLHPVAALAETFAEGQRVMFYGSGSPHPEDATRTYYLGKRPADMAPVRFAPGESSAQVTESIRSWKRDHVSEQDNVLQTRVGNFLSIRGMTWIWAPVTFGEAVTFPIEAPGITSTPQDVTLKLDFYYGAISIPLNMPIRIRVNRGERVLEEMPRPRSIDETPSITVTFPSSLLQQSDNTIELLFGTEGAPGDNIPPVFLDRIHLTYESAIVPEQGVLPMDLENISPDQELPVQLFASSFQDYRLNAVDITDPESPRKLIVDQAPGGQVVHAIAGPGRKVLLLNDDRIQSVHPGMVVHFAAVDTSKIEADTLIIHHPEFTEAAELLAQDIRGRGEAVHLQETEVLFDQYTGGRRVHTAIRSFLQELITRPSGGRLPYQVILIGDCSSDGRGMARNNIRNLLPTYSFVDPNRRETDQFATDSIYSWLAGDDELADVLIGRISVTNPKDARQVVEKTIRYRNQDPQPWANRIVTLTDPGVFDDKALKMARTGLGDAFAHRLIRIAEYPWENNFYLPEGRLSDEDRKVAPLVTAEILRSFTEGTALINYFGHGAPNLWSNQRVWFGGDTENSDNVLLENYDRLAFVTSFTCNNGAIDYPMNRWNVCIAEDMVRVPGGAVGVFMPSGPGFPEQHVLIAEGFIRAFTQLDEASLGVVSELARLAYQVRRGSDDHSRMYVYLGEPAMRAPVMKPSLSISAMGLDGQPVPSYPDAGLPMNVNATSEKPLRSAYLRIHDHVGTKLYESEMTIRGNVATRPVTPLRLELKAQPMFISVESEALDGTKEFGGMKLFLRDVDVLITDVVDEAERSRAMKRRYSIGLRNRGADRWTGELMVSIINPDGEVRGEVRVPAALRSGESKYFPVDIAPPAPGAWALQFRTDGGKPWLERHNAFPAPKISKVSIFGTAEPSLVLMKSEVIFDAPRSGVGDGIIRFLVANQGMHRVTSPFLVFNTSFANGFDLDRRTSQSIGALDSGTSRMVTVSTKTPREIAYPLLVYAQVTDENRREAWNSMNLELVRNIAPGEFADVVILPETLRIDPAAPSEGVSIIVRGKVRNAGKNISQPFQISLRQDANGAPGAIVPSIMRSAAQDIPALEAGAEYPFRVRWDPFNESGSLRFWVRADGEGRVMESNKTNNDRILSVFVRTGWKLEIAGLDMKRGEAANILLKARVRNTGETAAQRVSVRFYSRAPQTEENFLAEVIIPRIPPRSTAEAEFLWDVSQLPATMQVQPNFSIALKGSLQRISSLTEGRR